MAATHPSADTGNSLHCTQAEAIDLYAFRLMCMANILDLLLSSLFDKAQNSDAY